MKKLFPLVLAFSLLLTSCGTLEISLDQTPSPESPAATLAPTDIPLLSMSSSSEEIRDAMLKMGISDGWVQSLERLAEVVHHMNHHR